jgi:toxin YoeB
MPWCGTSDAIHSVGSASPSRCASRLAGWWSRRITGDHRIIYRLRDSGGEQQLEIVACRYHYAPRD